MTDLSEQQFGDQVEPWLIDAFGAESVAREPVLKDTQRRPDFTVETQLGTFAIELENDWEAAIKGAGQALLYRAHAPMDYALVLVPHGHVEEPERTYYEVRTPVSIREAPEAVSTPP